MEARFDYHRARIWDWQEDEEGDDKGGVTRMRRGRERESFLCCLDSR